MDTKKDILFVVPSQRERLYRHIVKQVIWAIESPKSYAIISGDAFSGRYGDMPTEAAIADMRAKYKQVGQMGDLSARERKAYYKIMDACIKYAQDEAAKREAQEAQPEAVA